MIICVTLQLFFVDGDTNNKTTMLVFFELSQLDLGDVQNKTGKHEGKWKVFRRIKPRLLRRNEKIINWKPRLSLKQNLSKV